MSPELAFVGDVHLDRDDPDVEAFVRLLDGLAGRVRAIVLVGDLFNLWIASPEFEGPHHEAVLRAVREVRAQGTAVHYVEGNRDYRIRRSLAGRDLDLVATDELDLVTSGGARIVAAHGDLANPGDLQYRAWRRWSRSAPFWWLVRALPRSRRAAFADGLERRLRATNLRFKNAFPEERVRRYGTALLARGRDLVVLGHFHERHELAALPPTLPGRIVVLPLWKDGRVHLEIGADGDLRWETRSG